MRVCQRAVAVVFALMLTALGGLASAEESSEQPADVASESPDTPVLLVLELATEEPGRSREQRFVSELELALDGVPIRTVEPAGGDFADLPLRKQIERVRPLIAQHGAAAAAWLDQVSAELILLHMVAVSSGRALARLIEIEPRAGFEADLALAARELLGTAFLFDEPPATQRSPIGQVVESVRREATAEPPAQAGIGWSVASVADLEGGAFGHSGPSLLLGGTLALEAGHGPGLAGRFSLGIRAGPLDGRDEAVSLFLLAAGPGALYLFELGPVLFGPALDLRVNWMHARVNDPDSARRRFDHWLFRVSAGLELRWRLTRRLALAAGVGAGVTPEREAYRYDALDRTVLVTPYVSWQTRVGLVLAIH